MPKLVLIADDNADNISLMRAILKRSALELEFADVQTGSEVLVFAAKRLPDIVLLDMKMPNMNGYETAAALRSNDRTKHIPIIAVTAQAMVGDKERALEAGCCEYITKPIDRTALVEAVTKYLAHKNDE
ncbi:MAG: response regulator [Candidatus Kryptoniota bacterium]